LFGAIILPQSNFNLLMQLPEMYNHCKSTEDKDMNVIDFVTDHLINIDCIFDKHDNGDHQKPHEPFNYHFQNNNVQLFVFNFLIKIIPNISHDIKTTYCVKNFYKSPYIGSIFHTPAI
jgi:hypothetical protein